MLHPVYEFRPLPSVLRPGFETYRFADGKWIPDDGEYDLAFVTHNVCWMVELPYQRNIIWQWLNGHWTDNERRHPKSNPWHYMLRDGETTWGGPWDRDSHPNTIAGRSGMNFACAAHRCANGRHVEFKLSDKHIAAGLVRERVTGLILTFPEHPHCMYCDDDGSIPLARSLGGCSARVEMM